MGIIVVDDGNRNQGFLSANTIIIKYSIIENIIISGLFFWVFYRSHTCYTYKYLNVSK